MSEDTYLLFCKTQLLLKTYWLFQIFSYRRMSKEPLLRSIYALDKSPWEGEQNCKSEEFCIIIVSLHSFFNDWKKSTDVPVREKLLAVAMGILNRISFGTWPHSIHLSANVCWYGSLKLQVRQLSVPLKAFWGIIFPWFGKIKNWTMNYLLGTGILSMGKKSMESHVVNSCNHTVTINVWNFHLKYLAWLVQPGVIY